MPPARTPLEWCAFGDIAPNSFSLNPGSAPGIGNRMNASAFRNLWARVMTDVLQILKIAQAEGECDLRT